MPSPSDPQTVERLARADEIRLLYEQSFLAVFASLLAAMVLCAVLWPVQSHAVLAGWFGTLTLTTMARLLLFHRYRRERPEGEALFAWERPYAVTLLLSIGVWGIGSLPLLHGIPLVHQLIVYFFLLGLAGGSFAVYAPRWPLMLGAVTILLLPGGLWMLLQHEPLTYGVLTSTAIFGVAVVRTGKVLVDRMHQSFVMGHLLSGAHAEAEREARVDPLTGLGNRRAFHERGSEMLAGPGEVCLILLDVDHFKSINDRFGHAVGDRVLQRIAKVLQGAVRGTDLCVRLGGEEFGVLVRVVDRKDAAVLAEKLRRLLETTDFCPQPGVGPLQVTASFGVAGPTGDLRRAYALADAALYRAKQAGRNRAVRAWDATSHEGGSGRSMARPANVEMESADGSRAPAAGFANDQEGAG